MRLPAPPGIGYKSSRILGLEESYLQVGGWVWLRLFGMVGIGCWDWLGSVAVIGWDWLRLFDRLGSVSGIGWDWLVVLVVEDSGTQGVLFSGWSQHCVMSSKNTKFLSANNFIVKTICEEFKSIL